MDLPIYGNIQLEFVGRRNLYTLIVCDETLIAKRCHNFFRFDRKAYYLRTSVYSSGQKMPHKIGKRSKSWYGEKAHRVHSSGGLPQESTTTYLATTTALPGGGGVYSYYRILMHFHTLKEQTSDKKIIKQAIYIYIGGEVAQC